jgi:predicted Zn-dependent protease with MMP-like domain
MTPEEFESAVQDALDSVPPELAGVMENVGIVIDEWPPPGSNLLGLYEGVPRTRRTSSYGGVLPDRITIYRGPLERYYGHDPALLHAQIHRVVLHEIAHHFGISDERLVEIDRY